MPVPPRFQSVRQSPLLSSPSVSPLLSAAQWINYLHVCAYTRCIIYTQIRALSLIHSGHSVAVYPPFRPVPSLTSGTQRLFPVSQSVIQLVGVSAFAQRGCRAVCSASPSLHSHTAPPSSSCSKVSRMGKDEQWTASRIYY